MFNLNEILLISNIRITNKMSDSDRITEVVDTPAEPVATSGASSVAAAAAPEPTAAEAPAVPERKPGYVSIVDIASYVGNAVKGFMLTPSDLRSIYLIVMWQFLNGHYIPEDGNLEGLAKIESDIAVQIPEKELNRILGICLNPVFRAFFLRIITL